MKKILDPIMLSSEQMAHNDFVGKGALLVLVDLSAESKVVIKHAIELAKILDWSIVLIHSCDSKEIVESENSSAVLTSAISLTYQIKGELNSHIEAIQKEGVSATYDYSFGSILLEISLKSQEFERVIVVSGKGLNHGKMATTPRKLIESGDLDVLLVDENKKVQPMVNFGLAVKERNSSLFHNDIVNRLESKLEKDVYSVMIAKTGADDNGQSSSATESKNRREAILNVIEGKSVAGGLQTFIDRFQIDLLMMGVGTYHNIFDRLFRKRSYVVIKILAEVEIPILLLSNPTKKKAIY